MCSQSCFLVASFPGPSAAFGSTNGREGPGMFPHMRDVEGRKDLIIERGRTGAQNSKKW